MTQPSLSPSLDAVEEAPVWLELNGAPAVTWMCTPDRLDELVAGWLYGEGYVETVDDIRSMRPCTQELGFWVEVPRERYETVEGAERQHGRESVVQVSSALEASRGQEARPE